MCNLSKGVAEKATAKGLQQGLQQGLEQARTEALSNLMSEMNLTLDQAMKVLKIPADEQAKYEAILKKQTLRLVFSKQGRDAYLLIQQAASLLCISFLNISANHHISPNLSNKSDGSIHAMLLPLKSSIFLVTIYSA